MMEESGIEATPPATPPVRSAGTDAAAAPMSSALSIPLSKPSVSSSSAYSSPLPAGSSSVPSPLPPTLMTSASLPPVPSSADSSLSPSQGCALSIPSPLTSSTSLYQFFDPSALSSTASPGIPAPPTGPPTSGFSMSSAYDITRGHAGRAPQSPLMLSFSSPSVTDILNDSTSQQVTSSSSLSPGSNSSITFPEELEDPRVSTARSGASPGRLWEFIKADPNASCVT